MWQDGGRCSTPGGCGPAEFDAIARDVARRLDEVRDPDVVSVVDAWLAKLTADGRGPDELDHLKLLQYMMANRRIGRPFRRPPLAGRLPPLGEHARPRGPCGRSAARAPDDGPADWPAAARRGAWRAGDSSDCAEDHEYDDGESRMDFYDDAGTTTDDGTSDAASASAVGVRDGHLAGGAGSSVWWGASVSNAAPAAAGAAAKEQYAELCDPCLDGFGLHLRRRRPGPMDAEYSGLLGECALPELTEAERAVVDPELLRVIQDVDDETTLQEFYFQVALYTCDQGSLMMKISDDMVDKFRAFVSDVFDSRVEHISDGLAYEQMSLSQKYVHLRDRAMNRATVVLDFLREAMPTFNWHKYRAEPDAYLKRQILQRPEGAGDDAEKASDDGTAGGGGGRGHGGDDDDDGSQQQSAIKKMLYTLNWLRSEETRMDCQCDQLYEQRSDLNAQLAQLNVQLSTAQCQSAGDIGRHKDEVTLLRQQSAEQAATIDRLLESIQLATVDKKSKPNEC